MAVTAILILDGNIFKRFLTYNTSGPDTSIHLLVQEVQSTLVISNSKGLTEILQDIRTSTYQS